MTNRWPKSFEESKTAALRCALVWFWKTSAHGARGRSDRRARAKFLGTRMLAWMRTVRTWTAGSNHAGVAIVLLAVLLLAVALPALVQAQPLPKVTLGVDTAKNPKDVAVTLQILALLTVLSVAPAIILLMTSFTRMVVVFHFLRQALGLQQMPPNQLIVGLSLFLTFFVMRPVLNDINANALQPYLAERISQKEAVERAQKPIREFMLRQTREKDLMLFVQLANMPQPRQPGDLPLSIVVPAFVVSELRIAFQIGFLLYIPFLMIDMIVASVLMSMGMLMLPPVMISLPFKILLFVLVDGWYLLVNSVVTSFH